MGRAYFQLLVIKQLVVGVLFLAVPIIRFMDNQQLAKAINIYVDQINNFIKQWGQPDYFIHGRRAAGTAHSVGTCSCRCRFINSHFDVTYGYESKIVSAPKPVTRIAPVAPQNAPKPLTMAPGPSCPVEADEPSREPVDAGFCVLPYGATPSSYESWFFINPPMVRESYITN